MPAGDATCRFSYESVFVFTLVFTFPLQKQKQKQKIIINNTKQDNSFPYFTVTTFTASTNCKKDGSQKCFTKTSQFILALFCDF